MKSKKQDGKQAGSIRITRNVIKQVRIFLGKNGENWKPQNKCGYHIVMNALIKINQDIVSFGEYDKCSRKYATFIKSDPTWDVDQRAKDFEDVKKFLYWIETNWCIS